MPEVSAVVYDCDGVLVDSREANMVTYQNLLEKAGYERPSEERITPLFHLPLRESLMVLTGVTDEKEINRITELLNDKSVRATHLFKFPPELEGVLEELHGGYKQGVATSRIQIGMDDVLEERAISQYFDTFVVREDYDQSKPSPDLLLVAAKRLIVPTCEVVYIGDSDVDVEAATAAGMMSIHLAEETHKDADVGITDFSEIPVAVRELSGI